MRYRRDPGIPEARDDRRSEGAREKRRRRLEERGFDEGGIGRMGEERREGEGEGRWVWGI